MIIYLGRDNTVRLRLEQDGDTVEQDAVTRAVLRFPGSAMESGDPMCLDTDEDDEISLTDNATVVEIDAGGKSFKTGFHRTLLTVYDAAHEDGLAWAEPTIRVVGWPVCE